MIPVNTYRNLWLYMATVIPGIQHVFTVHEETDMAAIIRDIDLNDILLIAVVPSAEIEATSADDIEEIDTCFVFLVKKTDRGSLTHDEFIDHLHETQVLMTAVKQKLIELSQDTEHLTPYSHTLHRLMIHGMHTDPEYNLLGCNGWGLSFKLKTKGTFNF